MTLLKKMFWSRILHQVNLEARESRSQNHRVGQDLSIIDAVAPVIRTESKPAQSQSGLIMINC